MLAEDRLKGLMIEALDGNSASYRSLMEEASLYLRRYFGRRLGAGRGPDAEDLVQETLLAIHARRFTYDAGRPFTVWLHAIARYKLIDHSRRRKLHLALPIDEVEDLFAADEAGPAMARLDVERLLETIPSRSRSLIRSVKLEGHSIADTAARQGMSEAAVKVGIHRGVKALAMRLRGRRVPHDE